MENSNYKGITPMVLFMCDLLRWQITHKLGLGYHPEQMKFSSIQIIEHVVQLLTKRLL
ncbi:hypothetical protein [Dokdonia pacifica]|uniref:Uncharacterized protein n=1 Tax=Dokdonia pacifica TaxID=1627892 RepID=A0A239AI73_9FLAO|nr:hypothetical protein [Dokdonia pacifica]SNR94734.1 hypothetical protein SAMN06265376_104421 [Dokdonia pacifica]